MWSWIRSGPRRYPRHWKWSSYGATAGLKSLTGLSLLMNTQSFGQQRANAQRKYSEFV